MSLLDSLEKGLIVVIGSDISGLKMGVQETQSELSKLDNTGDQWRSNLGQITDAQNNLGDSMLTTDKATGMLGDQIGVNIGQLMTWGVEIGAVVGAIALVYHELDKAATAAGDFGHAIEENSVMLGMTTDQYQEWSHVAIASGVSTDAFTSSVRMMSTRMKEAADPTSAMGKELASLHVKVVDGTGKYRDMNDVLMDTISAINKLPEGFKRNEASMEIFGRSWYQIAPLLKLSREEIDKLKADAPIFTPEENAAMADYHTHQAIVNEQFSIMMSEVGEKIIPLLTELTTGVTIAAIGFLEMGDAINVAGNALVYLNSAGQRGDPAGAYSQLNADFVRGGKMTDILLGDVERLDTSKTTSALSKSKALYKQLHSGVTVVQNNDYTTVALTDDQIATINEQNNKSLATQIGLSGGW